MEKKNFLPLIIQPPILPIVGFILQKDVYTTNLLYANDQFPLVSLKQRLPFRPTSDKRINLNDSIRILRERGSRSRNSEKSCSSNNIKSKLLIKKKLKFPLIRIKALPLTSLNLHENINRKDVKIKNIDDDLNITSNNGKKIFYRFKKQNKIANIKQTKLPSILNHNYNLLNSNYNAKFRQRKKKKDKNDYDNDKSMDKISLNNVVVELNKELKNIENIEKNRKRSFIRDTFFSTQIYVENIMDSKNREKKSMNILDFNY